MLPDSLAIPHVLKAQESKCARHWCLKNIPDQIRNSTCCIPVYFPKFQIQPGYKTRVNFLFFQLRHKHLQHVACSFWISDHVCVSIAQCYTEPNLQVLIKRTVLDCLLKKTFIKVNKTAGDCKILTKLLTWWNFSRWGRSSCFIHCE